VCDIIWCEKVKPDGKVCNTVNYLDPYNFWNWEGKIQCADCGTVYYIHMIQGHMYKGPEERKMEEADILPLYADKPLDGYSNFLPGTPGRTRPYHCLPRDIYLGKADMVRFSVRGKPVRGWRPQPPSAGIAGSFGFTWDIQKHAPEVWEEYQKKRAKGEVTEW
jgi:hypothetical protein